MVPSIASHCSVLRSLARESNRLALQRRPPARHLATLSDFLPSRRRDVPETENVADVAPDVAPESPEKVEGPSRPQLNIPVDPNHGLWAFFRKTVEKDGAVKYETVEARDARTDHTGRAWTAPELRRKSFKDLHTLWYVLLRERNLLATQKEELRRMGADPLRSPVYIKQNRVRKSMARMKYVINERRVAYEGAVKIFTEKRDAELAEKAARREAIERATAQKAEQARKAAEEAARPKEVAASVTATDLAAGGLFEDEGTTEGSAPDAEKKA